MPMRFRTNPQSGAGDNDDGTHRGLSRIRLSAARSGLPSDVLERLTAQVKHGLVFVSG
jgi:hypothetical protein